MAVRLLLLIFGLMILLSGGAAAQSDTIVLDRRVFYKQGIVGVYDLEGNFNPGRYKWSILTPSQIHLPALPNYVDPNGIQPFPTAPNDQKTRTLSGLYYEDCFESDRCEFSLPQSEAQTAKRLVVRLSGIDAPHLKASCEQESLLGIQAHTLIHEHLSSALHIELRNYSTNRREISGRVIADGQDLSEILLNQGLAVLFDGNQKDWCT